MTQQINSTIANAAAALLADRFPGLTGAQLTQAVAIWASSAATTNPRPEKPYTRKEAAALLSCSVQSIYRMMLDGRLKAVHVGKHSVRILPESIRALLGGAKQEIEH